jgi:hypothetical protein
MLLLIQVSYMFSGSTRFFWFRIRKSAILAPIVIFANIKVLAYTFPRTCIRCWALFKIFFLDTVRRKIPVLLYINEVFFRCFRNCYVVPNSFHIYKYTSLLFKGMALFLTLKSKALRCISNFVHEASFLLWKSIVQKQVYRKEEYQLV